MHCIHYASSLYGKLGDEMTGRFNQDLPENLHTAFEKAANFEPRIITKQSINERKVHDINHIDVTSCHNEIEINEAHIRNPITKVRITTLITRSTGHPTVHREPNHPPAIEKTTTTRCQHQNPETQAATQ